MTFNVRRTRTWSELGVRTPRKTSDAKVYARRAKITDIRTEECILLPRP
jgi:hypothetical protein